MTLVRFMKKDTEPLLPDTFYHIYNRSIGNEILFREEKNYSYFLNKYSQFLSPVADTYAYCLLPNHFHLLIRTKGLDEILNFKPQKKLIREEIETSSWILGNQFASFFRSYTLSINKTYDRTGGLFEESFRRKEINSDQYLSYLIYYIHANPQRHGLCEDYRDYPYSSYHSHLSKANTKLKRDDVIGWFGSSDNYKIFHSGFHDLRLIRDLILEF
jgi:putative transposase